MIYHLIVICDVCSVIRSSVIRLMAMAMARWRDGDGAMARWRWRDGASPACAELRCNRVHDASYLSA